MDLEKMPVTIVFGGKDSYNPKKATVTLKCPFKTEWVLDYRVSQFKRQTEYQ